MNDPIRNILGLWDTGKRLYQQVEGEVDREEFEYAVLMDQLLFGEKGLVDTLGPTWNMIHDPRFETIENCFIIVKRAVFGGNARTGVQTQLPDGTFTSGVTDLEQYTEILGEGRHFLRVVEAKRLAAAIRIAWPWKKFYSEKAIASEDGPKYPEITDGFKQWAQLSAGEQADVQAVIDADQGDLPPTGHQIKDLSESRLWKLIKQECPNYFRKNGECNEVGNTLFKLLKHDLLGLIADYAEVAKIQEWVLLDDKGTLCDDEQMANDEVPKVWYEIDILERALTFRAQLRVTAAKILRLLGIADKLGNLEVQTTDLERDNLLRIVYQSEWPDKKPELVVNLLGYLSYIKTQGTYEERLAAQCAQASEGSRAYIAQLKSGEIKPINRYTEPVIEIESTPEEIITDRILHHPLYGDLFFRYTAAEKTVMELQNPEGDNADEYPVGPVDPPVLSEQDQKRMDHAVFVATLLKPIFDSADYELTEEKYASLLREIFETSPEYAQVEVDGSEGALQTTPL